MKVCVQWNPVCGLPFIPLSYQGSGKMQARNTIRCFDTHPYFLGLVEQILCLTICFPGHRWPFGNKAPRLQKIMFTLS